MTEYNSTKKTQTSKNETRLRKYKQMKLEEDSCCCLSPVCNGGTEMLIGLKIKHI